MAAAFKMYRIICTITGKALVSGSNHPNCRPAYAFGRGPEYWYERGSWTHRGGMFWKTEGTVRGHIQNLCHDWKCVSTVPIYPRYPGERHYHFQVVRDSLDWTRLEHLSVEQLHVTEYSTVRLAASDFMGVNANAEPVQ
ncbi:MAG: hypothetical protein NT113_13275 [Hyphomicrobiales bacterium]|nr:hypothetical protein [Hyphomicrobiales bacterium]